MHVENELVEIVTTDYREFKEIVKEYEEEILMQEEVLEPPPTNSANTVPAQGKPWCITLIFYNHYLYMLYAFMLEESYENHLHRYNCSMSPTSQGSSSRYA